MNKYSILALNKWRLMRGMAVAAAVGALACCSVLQAALVGFYPFDGTNPREDASGQGRTLESADADPTHVTTGGFESGAYSFNGTQRWIAPIDINPETLPQMTMGAWVKTSTLQPALRKILGSDDGGWDRTIGLDDRNGPFRYASFNGNGITVGTPGPKDTNDWTFFAVTYDQDAAQAVLYVDLDAYTQEPLTPVTAEATFAFGAPTVSIGSVSPANAGEGWQGLIDNVFFYDELLTVERLTEIRNGGRSAFGVAGDDPNLVIPSAPDLQNLTKVPSVRTLSFPIRNTGATRPLNISRVTIEGPDASYFAVLVGQTNLPAGATGAIQIQFDSRGQVGSFSARATIESDDPGSPVVVIDLDSQVTSQALLGFYSFDDAANPLKDDSGSGKTLRNGSTNAAAVPAYAAAGGFSGGAFTFDGGDWLVAPIDINPTAVPRLGVGAWVKTASLEPGLRKVLGHDDGAWDRVIGLDTRAQPGGGPLEEGTFRYVAFTGTGNQGPTQGDPVPAPTSSDAWTFLAADYNQNSNRVTLYVDLDASTTTDEPQAIVADATMGPGATSVSIGSISPGGAGEAWVGDIDNVFFVSGGLDAATMKLIRDGGKNALLQFGPDPALVVDTASPFGSLPNRAPRTVQIEVRNGGASQPLQIVNSRLIGPDAAAFTLGTVPATIAPGGTALIPVTVTPTEGGSLRASLELTSNNSGGRFTTIDLSTDVPFDSLASALLGFYTFDDEANPLKDDSGKGNDLLPSDGPATHVASGGFEGGYHSFDGFQHLIGPFNINPSVHPQLTMGAWVKTESLDPGLRKVMGHDNGGWDRTIGLDNREPNTLPLRYTTFVGNGTPLEGTPEPVNTEDWTFLAATYDQSGAIATMYVDLDAASTNDALVAVSRANSVFNEGFNTFAIGNLRPDTFAEGWIGGIDNVFVFNSILSPSDLTTLRNRGKAALLDETPVETIQITSVQKPAAGVVLTWTSRVGANYTIEYSETLPGTWTPIGTQAGQAGTTSFTDSDATRLGRRTGFYRVSIP